MAIPREYTCYGCDVKFSFSGSFGPFLGGMGPYCGRCYEEVEAMYQRQPSFRSRLRAAWRAFTGGW